MHHGTAAAFTPHMSTAASLLPSITYVTRCTYAAYLVTTIGAVALVLLAFGEGSLPLVFPAALSGLVAWLLRTRLAATGELAACAAEDDEPIAVPANVGGTGCDEYNTLLARSAALDRLRGTSGFDPWEYLELRRQLHACQPPPH